MKNVRHFDDLTLTFNRCASFDYHSITVHVTWPSFDQSTEHLVVGQTTPSRVSRHWCHVP